MRWVVKKVEKVVHLEVRRVMGEGWGLFEVYGTHGTTKLCAKKTAVEALKKAEKYKKLWAELNETTIAFNNKIVH